MKNLKLPRELILSRVIESLEHLKIQHLMNRETFNLSGGEKQKVALAGELAMHPSIIVTDS